MTNAESLRSLPDDVLLRRLAELTSQSRRIEVDLVMHIGEVDARRLYAREACPSMFAYCIERLHLSGAEAFLRITAARASREHPALLEMLADGRLHLTAIALLAPHLTVQNSHDVLRRAVHRTKREIQELVAALSPQPDAPTLIRRLASPTRHNDGRRLQLEANSSPLQLEASARGGCAGLGQIGTSNGESRAQEAVETTKELRLDGVPAQCAAAGVTSVLVAGSDTPASVPAVSGRAGVAIDPIAPARYKVQFTASAELRDKLERLRALMHSSVPDGDLAAIIEEAVTEKLVRLESRRFADTPRPRTPERQTDAHRADGPKRPTQEPAARSRYIPAAVRRQVNRRDAARCAYTNAAGQRCTARHDLEFHHRRPYGCGGDHSVDNVALLCRTHNRLLAELDWGSRKVPGC